MSYTIPQISATKILPRGDDYLESGGVTDGSAKILVGNFSQTVTTLAALKALSITNAIDGQCVLSKVGGIFYYDSSSTATPDNVTIVQPNAGSGRWLAAPGAFTTLSASGVFSLTNATRNYVISNDGSSYRALELRGSTIEFNPSNGGIVGVFSTTGLAVTGVLGVTGNISRTGSGMAAGYLNVNNTGNDAYFGVNNSTGSTFAASAYDVVVQGAIGTAVSLSIAGTGAVARVTATGLVVTGSLSTTGAVSVSNTAATVSSGTGSPESAVTAPVGSIYMRTNGGASTSFYVKESGAGNTGWVAK